MGARTSPGRGVTSMSARARRSSAAISGVVVFRHSSFHHSICSALPSGKNREVKTWRKAGRLDHTLQVLHPSRERNVPHLPVGHAAAALVVAEDDTTARLVLWSLFAFGWGLVLVCTFLINHFDLFGVRPAAGVAVRDGVPVHSPAIRHTVTLSPRSTPLVRWLVLRLLGDTDHDALASALRGRDHRLHPRRHPLRGARPRLRRVSPPRPDAMAVRPSIGPGLSAHSAARRRALVLTGEREPRKQVTGRPRASTSVSAARCHGKSTT